MEKNIINSLKRLERVGSETSIVTTKLKKACEKIGAALEEKLVPLLKKTDAYDFQQITKDLYFLDTKILFDYDGKLRLENSNKYRLNPSEGWITRECALEFAREISANNLLEKVADYIDAEKKKMESAVSGIENIQV